MFLIIPLTHVKQYLMLKLSYLSNYRLYITTDSYNNKRNG